MAGYTTDRTAVRSEGQKTENPKKIKAVIFDLDATLVDSEPNYYEADRRLMSEYGVPDFSMEDKKKYIGGSSLDMIIDIKKIYNISESVECLLEKKNRYYLEVAKKKTRVFPEMKKLLSILKEQGFKLALASGSSRAAIDVVISATNLGGYFDVDLSTEDVKRGKPNPDVFLEAARRMGVAPECCLALEDSVYGVEAAKSAGMFCIGIPYLKEMSDHESYAKADLLFPEGMAGFTAPQALEWINNLNSKGYEKYV